MNCLTVDVEDWFHILSSPAVPSVDQWSALPTRLPVNMSRILDLLGRYNARATFFWLGWLAERHKKLVLRCVAEGHEIASHGYAHLLPYEVGPTVFREDIARAKSILEDVIGRQVIGFRSPGFGVLKTTPWVFDVICETGHLYDASVFPACHGHGGQVDAPLVPYMIDTEYGRLCEVPVSLTKWCGWRVSLFGGGYLRLAPKPLIAWGARRLKNAGRPLVVYFHPREIDPEQPRLCLPLKRRFKCYVNLRTTFDKIQWLCSNYEFTTMRDLIHQSGLGMSSVNCESTDT